MPQLKDQNGNVMSGVYPMGTCQKVAFDASAAIGVAVGVDTHFVRIVVTNAAYVLTGAAPTALNDGTCILIPASTPVVIPIAPGHKVAAIKHTTAGDLTVMEIA